MSTAAAKTTLSSARRKSAPPSSATPAWARKLGMSDRQYQLVGARRAEIEAVLRAVKTDPKYQNPLPEAVAALPFWARGLKLTDDEYDLLCASEAMKEGTIGAAASADFLREASARGARRRAAANREN